MSTGAPGSADVPVIARLCYVDDSRTSAYVVRRLLQPFGYQVDHFSSAEPAFVALVQEDYDLLLTDLKVSPTGMDGDELIRTLRQSGHPKISIMPIIVITGTTDAEVLVGVYDAGANQVMKKPVSADELDGHIRRLLFDGRPARAILSEQKPKPKTRPTARPKTKPEKMDRGPGGGKVVTLHTVHRPSHKPGLPTTPQQAFRSPSESAAVEKTDIPVLHRTPPVVKSVRPAVPARSVLPATKVTKDSSVLRAMEKKPGAVTDNKTTDVSQPAPVVIGKPDKNKEKSTVEPNTKGGQNVRNAAQAIDDNILGEIEQYPLMENQHMDLFDRSGTPTGMLHSLVELVGVRGLIMRVLGIGIVVVALLMAWRVYFDPGQPVDTVSVKFGEIFQSIAVSGRVVSKQRVDVGSARAGRLVEILVKEGDKVKQGQVLAKIDGRELMSRLNRVKISLSSAREDIVLAQRSLDRLRKAHAKGAVARHSVEDAEADLRAARNKASIAAEEVRSATLEFDSQKMTAAFDATVIARSAEIGQWVEPAETLFTLMDESQREIEAHVDAADSVAVDVGQVVMVSSDAFPGLEWQEAVVRLGAEADSKKNANSVKVYISLGSDAPVLRYGQQVNADIRTIWSPNTLKIPFGALISHGKQTVVAVMEDDRVRMRIIETGIEDFSMVEVRQGLSAGETVILPGGITLKNGGKVYRKQDNE